MSTETAGTYCTCSTWAGMRDVACPTHGDEPAEAHDVDTSQGEEPPDA